jgi:hypothetical protein
MRSHLSPFLLILSDTVALNATGSYFYYLRSNIYRHTIAHSILPKIGATINNHNWLIAAPPTSKPGPMLLAGFTDTPVTGIPTI